MRALGKGLDVSQAIDSFVDNTHTVRRCINVLCVYQSRGSPAGMLLLPMARAYGVRNSTKS